MSFQCRGTRKFITSHTLSQQHTHIHTPQANIYFLSTRVRSETDLTSYFKRLRSTKRMTSLSSSSPSQLYEDAIRGYENDPTIWEEMCTQKTVSYEATPSSVETSSENIVLVMSSSEEKRDRIRKTWNYDKNIIFVVYGKEKPQDTFHNDIVLSKSHRNRQNAFADAAAYISSHFQNLKFVLKTDDSFVCRPHDLFDELRHTSHQNHLYWGHLGDPRYGEGHCEDDFGDHFDLFPPYHAGAYVLSSLTLRTLSCRLGSIQERKFYPSEDVLTGTLLKQAGVRYKSDRTRFTFFSSSHSASNWICALDVPSSNPSAVSPPSSSVVDLGKMNSILGHYFPPVSQSAELLIGILSGPKNVDRRSKIRETWMQYYNSQSPFASREHHIWFIVGHADCAKNDKKKMESLMIESAKYGDMLILPYVTESYHGKSALRIVYLRG
jgi:hypothetical protein